MSFAVQFEMFMKFFHLNGNENSADHSVSGRRSDRFDGGRFSAPEQAVRHQTRILRVLSQLDDELN